MARQLAITKRTSLDGFAGWDETCYIEWRPITYGEQASLSQISETDETAALTAMLDLIKSHVIGGKVRIIGDDGREALVDLEKDDVDQMAPDMINRIFADMTGVDLTDPKGEISPNAPSDTARQ